MNKKLVMLWIMLTVVSFLIVFLTVIGVEISTPTPEKQYVLENVEYLGSDNKSCYRTTCSGTLKFQNGENVYQLQGTSHELKTLVVGSHYNVYYNNFDKKIKNYDFAINGE